VIFDLSFPHNYSVGRADLPSGQGGTSARYFRAPHTADREDWSIVLEIGPAGDAPWIGVFGRDSSMTSECSKIMSTPDPSILLVIAEGQAFVVNVEDPSKVMYPPCFPVHQAISIMSQGIVVLADDTDLVAIGRSGIAWESGRLVTDDLRLVSTKGDRIGATGFVGSDGDVEFEVDPRTGRIIGRAFSV
jgi:hypothetical protein